MLNRKKDKPTKKKTFKSFAELRETQKRKVIPNGYEVLTADYSEEVPKEPTEKPQNQS